MNTDDLTSSHRTLSWKDFFFAPIGCLLSFSPVVAFGSLLIMVMAGLFVYHNVNTEIFGIGRPPYEHLQIDNTWEHVSLGNLNWTVQYESYTPTIFTGLVRFIGPIRQQGIPFLTHDVLVTSGEFADPTLVNTRVFNHTFSWYARERQQPQGAINLLHTVPQKEAIYEQLLALKTGQQVRVTGFEIQIIDAYNQQGERYMWWQDSGCNTLLVTKIDVLNP
jgi:hypothetical protein